MGCVSIKKKKKEEENNVSNSENKNNQYNIQPTDKTDKKTVKTKEEFNITIGDMVSEKYGKIQKDYTILNPPLGKGAFGEVRKAIHKATNMVRAIKIINKADTTKEEQEKLVNEVQILKTLDHPNIIKVYEFYQDDKFFYIVTEICSGGELFDKIIESTNFGEKMAARVFKQLLSAVFYCHQHNIVHRDLKPENLLLESKKDDAMIKLIDFGTSRFFDNNKKMHQKFGTPYYIAPEVLKKRYDEKCDIWSCGVILYIFLSGYPPFNGPNDKAIMESVAAGVYNFEGKEWKSISLEAKNFIKKMLQFDPAKRVGCEDAMKDPWIKKFNDKTTVSEPLMNSVLNNLSKFRAEQKLQEATWIFFVNYLASKDEKNQLLKTFQALDTNGDGQLSKNELIDGYKKTLGLEKAEEEVEKIMKSVDKNNSGAIDYTEFVMATISMENLLSKERLETAFKMFDKDGSGSISIKELKENFGGSKISDSVWLSLIKEVDVNGDGEISYKEFKDMMLKLLDPAEQK